MSVRPHLARSQEPIIHGRDVPALCSTDSKPVIVARAEQIPLSDKDKEPRTLGGICRECLAIAANGGLFYESAIVPGQELKEKQEEED